MSINPNHSEGEERRPVDTDRTQSLRGWRVDWFALAAAVVALTGLLVFIYPSTAAWWSQYEQSMVIDNLSARVTANLPPGNHERLEQAREYNRMLNSGDIVVGTDSRKPTTDGVSGDGVLSYEELLDLGDGLMARLRIPAIGVDLPVYHGTSDEVLTKGVGHLEGTSLPVGGVDTHSVLTAHRGLATATLFNDLNKLALGDIFTIQIVGDVITYQVIETQVVEPSDSRTLLMRPDEDLVTLVTCTPLGINTHRILVTGQRITPTPPDEESAAMATPEVPGFPWWAVIIPTGFVLAGVFVWRSGIQAGRVNR